jgi:hypothetical protein
MSVVAHVRLRLPEPKNSSTPRALVHIVVSVHRRRGTSIARAEPAPRTLCFAAATTITAGRLARGSAGSTDDRKL